MFLIHRHLKLDSFIICQRISSIFFVDLKKRKSKLRLLEVVEKYLFFFI